jgi:hypothetical protein
MKNSALIYDSLLTGCSSSLISTLALILRSKKDNGSYTATVNAISHWLYGDEAFAHIKPDIRHTLIGYGIHHMSATLWAGVYEKWFPMQAGKAPEKIILDAFKVAFLACFVDYKLTPQRFQPGYETHLSTRSLAIVYAAFAIGLAAPQLTKSK